MARSDTHTAIDGFTVTPSDSAGLTRTVRSLYVGTGGNMAVTTVEGNNVTFVGVQSGTVIPIQAQKVLSTGTTASNIVGLV